jgi:hypothetical protein
VPAWCVIGRRQEDALSGQIVRGAGLTCIEKTGIHANARDAAHIFVRAGRGLGATAAAITASVSSTATAGAMRMLRILMMLAGVCLGIIDRQAKGER